MGTSSTRRNLFQHRLGRHAASYVPPGRAGEEAPKPGIDSALSSQNILRGNSSAEGVASHLTSWGTVDNGEIVSRDTNGGYKSIIPVLPSLPAEDGDEMEGIEHAGPGARVPGVVGVESTTETRISGREKEKIEASLVELMCRNGNRQMSSEPGEILNLILQSLRNQVASLDEDNWMYEAEEDART